MFQSPNTTMTRTTTKCWFSIKQASTCSHGQHDCGWRSSVNTVHSCGRSRFVDVHSHPEAPFRHQFLQPRFTFHCSRKKTGNVVVLFDDDGEQFSVFFVMCDRRVLPPNGKLAADVTHFLRFLSCSHKLQRTTERPSSDRLSLRQSSVVTVSSGTIPTFKRSRIWFIYITMVAQDEPSSAATPTTSVHDIPPEKAATTTKTMTNNTTTTTTTPKSDNDKSAALLAQAPGILQAIDDAHIIVHGDHEQRALPRFVWDELTVGDFLGEGGYGVVYKVSNIKLQPPSSPLSSSSPQDDELEKAREFMEHHCHRQGMARYAVKRNKTAAEGLSRVHHRARGQIDLAVEAKYLSTVSHPNIIKLRGMAQGPLVDEHFFILLDRLEMTLDVQMKAWGKEHKELVRQQQKAPWWRKRAIGKKTQQALQDLMVHRLTVALDLAKAFQYLHEHR
eukprot:scaffold5139_cov155-Amphora_coffeaeformis.AAC.1